MTRALISGGTGFIGANLARRLLREGHDVHLLMRPDSDPWRVTELYDRLTTHTVDSVERLKKNVRDIAADWVFNLAVYGAYPHQTDVDRMIDTNLRYATHLLESCLDIGFEAFVLAGSSSEYGLKDHAAHEDEVPEPNSAYAVTKLAATMYSRYAAQRTGANIKVLRLYSVFGPWEDFGRFLPRLITEALEGRLPPLANPENARDFVYVDDVCDAFIAATSAVGRGGVFNIGTGKQTTLREAVDIVRQLLPTREQPQWGTMPSRSWDSVSWKADPTLARETLGWSARVAFPDGLQKMISWFREYASQSESH